MRPGQAWYIYGANRSEKYGVFSDAGQLDLYESELKNDDTDFMDRLDPINLIEDWTIFMHPDFSYDSKDEYKVQTIDLTYRRDNDGDWPARIYLPEKKGPFPALLDIHGGAWNHGGFSDNEKFDLSFASSGLAVLAIECRKAPTYKFPAQVADVNYATRWLKAHAHEFNIVPDGIGGFGTSSGGHALFLSAMHPADPLYASLPLSEGGDVDAKLSYIVGAWPVIDPYQRYMFAQNNNNDFLIGATNNYFLDQDAMTAGSPLQSFNKEGLDLPPGLIIQGTNDQNVPLSTVTAFAESYGAAGGSMDVQWFENMPHNFAYEPFPESDKAMDAIKHFIQRQLDGKARAQRHPGED